MRDQLDTAAAGPRFIELDRHLCHAAGAFCDGGWQRAAIVSLDGYGAGFCDLLADGRDGRSDELQGTVEADSIGTEGKTQGPVAYGESRPLQASMNGFDIAGSLHRDLPDC